MNPFSIAFGKFKQILEIPPVSESEASRILLFVFTNSVALSVWYSNVWTPFIFTSFGESNLLVGLMAAINGISEMSMAILSGFLADKVWGPSRTLQIAQLIGMFAFTVFLIGVWLSNIYLLGVAQSLEGAYMGFSFTSVESVFAQCLRTGERDWLYSVKFSLESSGPIVGLCLTIILFIIFGNQWNLRVLQLMMTTGLCLNVVSMLTFLCTFKPLPHHIDKKVTHKRINVVVFSDMANKDAKKVLEHGQEGDHQVSDEGISSKEEYVGQKNEHVAVDLREISIKSAPNQSFINPCPGFSEADKINKSFAGSHRALDSAVVGPEGVGYVELDSKSLYPPNSSSVFEGKAVNKDDNLPNSTRLLLTQNKNCGHLDPDPNANGEARKDPSQPGPVRKLCYIDIEAEEAKGCRRKILRWIPLSYYPYVLIVFDVIIVFGSGMTVQYFTLFMMKIYDVSPLEMATLSLFSAMTIMGLAMLCGIIAKRYGRVRTILPPKFIATMILLWMVLARGRKGGVKVWMCVAYILRGALMNCSAGLSRAIVMDIIPDHYHGRWNAIESIQSAGWSGTAFLGGFLADRWDYGGAFIVTFCFHFVSCMLLLPLTLRNDTRMLVAREVDDAARNSSPNSTEIAAERQDGDHHGEKSIAAADKPPIATNNISSNDSEFSGRSLG
ncbi:unnamed protein product [Phytomonas sp. Hart1]|nr:unnamed protein product [Phytomonas sp. Hart1]|eukprot:CCW66513.1 unnamed protein product [Phytomonas sp. isolate Hart1]